MKKSIRPKTKKDKSIRLREGERIHVGIDVHLEKNVLTLWSATTDYPVVTWTLPADPEAIANTLRPFAAHIERVVYEAGPTGFSLARLLREEGFKTDVISPADIARPQKKTPKAIGSTAAPWPACRSTANSTKRSTCRLPTSRTSANSSARAISWPKNCVASSSRSKAC